MTDFVRVDWSKAIELNDSEIDNDHKELMMIYNDLVDIANTNKDSESFVEYLSKMTNYSLRHFKKEELLMKELAYPNFVKHQSEHKTFIYEVAMFNLEFVNDRTTINKILTFLKDWWIKHINTYDSEIALYINNKE